MEWIRVAIDDHGGKWEPGTVLGVYPDARADVDLLWGDRAWFLAMRVQNLTDEQKEAVRMRKMKVDLPSVLSSKQIDDARANRIATSAAAVRTIEIAETRPAYMETKKEFWSKTVATEVIESDPKETGDAGDL